MAFGSKPASPRRRQKTAPLFVIALGLLVAFPAAPAPAAPGDLDPTFSTDGELTTYGGRASVAIAVQPDGKVLITGPTTSEDSPPAGFLLERALANGGLDGSFGNGGRVQTAFDGGGAAKAVALQPDGRIVVAGESGSGDFALARYLPDGSLDDSFSDDGLLTTDLTDRVSDVVLQPDGRILEAGCSYATQGLGADFQLARFNADGSLDDSFSDDGLLTLDFGCGYFRGRVALAPDGGIVLASNSKSSFDIAVARLRPDGTLDPSFSDDGMLTADPSGDTDWVGDVVVQPDGKIVTAGYGLVPVPGSDFDRRFEFELVRFQPDGELDPTFSGGVVTTRVGWEAMARGLALQPDGKLIAAGESSDDFAVARYNPDGTLDDSFSYDGKLTTSFSRLAYEYYLTTVADDVALAPDGKIVVGGHSKWEWEGELWALARYEVSPGPHDADADGVRDTLDKCPAIFATNDVGCFHFRRSLSIRYANKYDEFRGRLSGGGWDCEVHQRVGVFKRRSGPDRRIGRSPTGYDGEWEVSLFRPRGRYYARVKRRIYPSWGLCAAARSEGLAFER
jgi:uncharacterized delta-60 repeat protein